MFEETTLRENKYRIFARFISAVRDIAKCKEPEDFRDTTYSLEHALKYFPEDQKKEIQDMVVTATEQYLYVQALAQVRRAEPRHEQREKQIYEFLAKYHT